MTLWASLLLWDPFLLLGTQTPLGLCSHLAYSQGHLRRHSRKGQRSFLLSLVHHSACPPHLLQTGMSRSLLRAKAQRKPGPWAPAKVKQPALYSHKHEDKNLWDVGEQGSNQNGPLLRVPQVGSWGDLRDQCQAPQWGQEWGWDTKIGACRSQGSKARTGLQGEKATMGWRRLSREGGLGFGPLMESWHSPANPTVGGGVQMLVITYLLRVWGLLIYLPGGSPGLREG